MEGAALQATCRLLKKAGENFKFWGVGLDWRLGWCLAENLWVGGFTPAHFFVKKKFGRAGTKQVRRPIYEKVIIIPMKRHRPNRLPFTKRLLCNLSELSRRTP